MRLRQQVVDPRRWYTGRSRSRANWRRRLCSGPSRSGSRAESDRRFQFGPPQAPTIPCVKPVRGQGVDALDKAISIVDALGRPIARFQRRDAHAAWWPVTSRAMRRAGFGSRPAWARASFAFAASSIVGQLPLFTAGKRSHRAGPCFGSHRTATVTLRGSQLRGDCAWRRRLSPRRYSRYSDGAGELQHFQARAAGSATGWLSPAAGTRAAMS